MAREMATADPEARAAFIAQEHADAPLRVEALNDQGSAMLTRGIEAMREVFESEPSGLAANRYFYDYFATSRQRDLIDEMDVGELDD